MGSSRLKFATEEADINALQMIYSLMQCTPDLSGRDCELCLRQCVADWKCFLRTEGGNSERANCYFGWALYLFYSPRTKAPPPPLTDTLQIEASVSTHPLQGKEDKTSLTVIIIVVVAAAAIMLLLIFICILVFILKKSRRKIRKVTILSSLKASTRYSLEKETFPFPGSCTVRKYILSTENVALSGSVHISDDLLSTMQYCLRGFRNQISLFSCLLIVSINLAVTNGGTEFYCHDTGNPFDYNRNLILSSLASHVTINYGGFNKTTIGKDLAEFMLLHSVEEIVPQMKSVTAVSNPYPKIL
ncbi:hypothetical protein QYF36_010615 [Acer negundo]|nr:hypothetical protein QYF36_010615 [Acer negundo]